MKHEHGTSFRGPEIFDGTMPPAIADSDDDGDCEDLVKSFNVGSESPLLAMPDGNDVAGLDGAMDTTSTGSTGKIIMLPLR